MNAEVWETIPGSDGWYEVSTEGRVRSWIGARRQSRRETPRILSSAASRSGYPIVNLTLNGKHTCRSVHSLVLLAFVGPRPDGMEARHLNGTREDARLVNLVYGTPKENSADKRLHGTQPLGKSHPHAKLNYLKAKAIRSLHETGEYSYRDLGEVFGVGIGTVRKILRGETWIEAVERIAV